MYECLSPSSTWSLNKWMNKIHWAAPYAKYHPRQLGDKVWGYFIYFPNQGSVGPMFLSLLWSSTSIPILLKTGPPHPYSVSLPLTARKAERMEPEPSWPCQRGLSASLHHWHGWLGWSEFGKGCDDAWSLLLTVWISSAAAGSLKWPLPSHMEVSLKQAVSWESFRYKWAQKQPCLPEAGASVPVRVHPSTTEAQPQWFNQIGIVSLVKGAQRKLSKVVQQSTMESLSQASASV